MIRTIAAAFLLCAGSAWANGGVISYQGRLTDPAGAPITAPVDVLFAFYDAPVDGSKLGGFLDIDTVTPDAQGIYSTMIGDDPDVPVPAGIFAAGPVWLEVSVNGQALLPRKQIAAAPSALTAQWSGALVNEFPMADGIAPIAKDSIVSILMTGKVRGSSIPDAPTPAASFAIGGATYIRAMKLDEQRALVVWRDSVTNVSVVDFSGGTPLFGTPATTFLYGSGVEIALLGTGRAVLHDANSSSPFQIAEIAGNTVTLSDSIFEPGDISGANPSSFRMDGLSGTDFVFCYTTQFIGQGFVRIGRVESGGITFGAAASNDALARDIVRLIPRQVEGSRLAFAFARGLVEPPKLKMMLGTRTDTTVDIAASSAAELTTASVRDLTDFRLMTPSRGALLYQGENFAPHLMGVEFAPFFRNSNGLPLTRRGRATQSAAIAPIDSTSMLVTEAGPDAQRYARIATFFFAEPQFDDPHGFNLSPGYSTAAAALPLSPTLIASFQTSSSQSTLSMVGVPPAENLRIPIGAIGFAAVEAAGPNALVATHGVVRDFGPAPGLVGPVYDIGNGTIGFGDGRQLGRVGFRLANGDLLIDATPLR